MNGISASITIRQFHPTDHAAVLKLHERAMRQIDAYMGPGPWNDDLLDITSSYMGNAGEFLVGVIDERIVAMGAFRRTDTKRAEIKRMRVDPEYQGRGYGRTILYALEERARAMGYEVLHLDTTAAQPAALHLYRNHGYIQTGIMVFRGVEMLLLEKRLVRGEKDG